MELNLNKEVKSLQGEVFGKMHEMVAGYLEKETKFDAVKLYGIAKKLMEKDGVIEIDHSDLELLRKVFMQENIMWNGPRAQILMAMDDASLNDRKEKS